MRDWPRRFIYVCSATKAGMVNTVPMVFAGRERLAEVVVLCGARDEDTRDPTELREAVDPLNRLRRFAEDVAPGILVTPLFGDPADPAQWFGHLSAVMQAASAGCPVVFNIKGGTKEMAIGALAPVLAAPRGHGMVITVGDGLRVDFLDLLEGGPPEEAPASAGFSLGAYLASQGFRERNRKARDAKEAMALYYRDAILDVARALLADTERLMPPVTEALRALEVKEGGKGRKGELRGGDIAPTRTGACRPQDRVEAARIIARLGGLPGLSVVRGDDEEPVLRAANATAARLVQGGWLELYLFLRLRQRFGNDPRVETMLGVDLAFDSREAGDPNTAIGEFDVAVLVHDQLHVLEVKLSQLGAAGSEGPENLLNQGLRWKANLLGQLGEFILVAPRVTADRLSRSNAFMDKARQAGIALALGPDAVEMAVERLAALAARD